METFHCDAQECDGFDGMKESRVLWLGNTDTILGVGFNKVRTRLSSSHSVLITLAMDVFDDKIILQ